MSCAFIAEFVNMINCIIFSCKVDDFSFVITKLAAHCEWNQCQIAEVYCLLQSLWN